jgi:cell wall-associated NlpC family hydrolase
MLALAGSLSLCSGGAYSQQAYAPLNVVPTRSEELGRVPNHFIYLRRNLQAVKDPVDGQLVFLNDAGRVVGRSDLPPDFRIGEVVPEAGAVRLVEASGRSQVLIQRAINAGSRKSFPASKLTKQETKSAPRLTRVDATRLLYGSDNKRGQKRLDIRSVSGGRLAQVYEVGPPQSRNRYIVIEEIVASAPKLHVRTFALRYSHEGRVTGVAYLPIDEMDVVPRDFVTVTDGGELRVLIPTKSGVTIREIQFSSPNVMPAKSVGTGDVEFKRVGTVKKEITVETKVSALSEPALVRAEIPRFTLRVTEPSIKRETILKNARAFMTVNWTMRAENFSKLDVANRCEPGTGAFWSRPTRFASATIGKTIGPMPYRWGGDDTPESYRSRLELGALAGDMCTCRDAALNYCLYANSAGSDCSGFVSRAWGIEKRGTSGLLDVSVEVNNITDMRPGDAFDLPGSHVRLLVAVAPGAATAFTVLESSTRRECEGVCERTYRPSELNKFQLIRYRGIAE